MKTIKETLIEMYEDENLYAILEGELTESAGALAGIPDHIKKSMTGSYDNRAGEHSNTTTQSVKTKSATQSAATASLKDNKHVIIKHDGKVIGSVHPTSGIATSRAEHRLHGATPPDARYYHFHVNRGDAVSHIHKLIDGAGGYDGHHVEIHTVETDHVRQAKRKERAALADNSSVFAKPGTQRGSLKQPKSLAAGTTRAVEKMIHKHGDSSKGDDVRGAGERIARNGHGDSWSSDRFVKALRKLKDSKQQ